MRMYMFDMLKGLAIATAVACAVSSCKPFEEEARGDEPRVNMEQWSGCIMLTTNAEEAILGTSDCEESNNAIQDLFDKYEGVRIGLKPYDGQGRQTHFWVRNGKGDEGCPPQFIVFERGRLVAKYLGYENRDHEMLVKRHPAFIDSPQKKAVAISRLREDGVVEVQVNVPRDAKGVISVPVDLPLRKANQKQVYGEPVPAPPAAEAEGGQRTTRPTEEELESFLKDRAEEGSDFQSYSRPRVDGVPVELTNFGPSAAAFGCGGSSMAMSMPYSGCGGGGMPPGNGGGGGFVPSQSYAMSYTMPQQSYGYSMPQQPVVQQYYNYSQPYAAYRPYSYNPLAAMFNPYSYNPYAYNPYASPWASPWAATPWWARRSHHHHHHNGNGNGGNGNGNGTTAMMLQRGWSGNFGGMPFNLARFGSN